MIVSTPFRRVNFDEETTVYRGRPQRAISDSALAIVREYIRDANKKGAYMTLETLWQYLEEVAPEQEFSIRTLVPCQRCSVVSCLSFSARMQPCPVSQSTTLQRRTRLHTGKKNPAQYPDISALTGHWAKHLIHPSLNDHDRPHRGAIAANRACPNMGNLRAVTRLR